MAPSLRRIRRKYRCWRQYGAECPHGRGHCRRKARKVIAPTKLRSGGF